MRVHILVILLMGMSFAFTGLGGLMDMSGQKNWYGITKKHAWNDGLYLLVLAILVFLLTTFRGSR